MKLSGRQLEIARLAARGLSNDEIARELAIARGTVKAHLCAVYGRLGANGRRDLLLALVFHRAATIDDIAGSRC